MNSDHHLRTAAHLIILFSVFSRTAAGQSEGASAGNASQATPSTHVVQLGQVKLTVPVGLTVRKVADQPLIKWPVVADWDSHGRLVVVESGGVSRPIDQHNQKRLHRVVRLVDQDQDGAFDQRIVAADNLPFAEGVLCVGDDLLVAAPPQIFRLTDSDGDGRCEQRHIWYDAKTITGCANDLHGPYQGRDGWIYWCKGAFAEQTHQLPSGERFVTSAAHIFRRRFEGGPVEPVMTGGMDNPVEVAFLPNGERFFTSTFLQHPSDGLRDGVAHAVYGGVYGKKHHVIDRHRRTGDLMPIMTQLGAAAPSGLAYLESPKVARPLFPQRPHVLAAALFNHHKVTLHALRAVGAGFESEDRDLLVADRIDFHPTDVVEAGDGDLIVIDTGGWYDLCCPSSRVDQTTAAGGIYRISPAKKVRDAGLPVEVRQALADRIGVDQRIDDLSAVDKVTRHAAVSFLIKNAERTTPALVERMSASNAPTRHRIDALWALCRIGSPQALTAVTAVMSDSSAPADLVHAAAHAVGVHRFQPAARALKECIAHRDPQVRRAAAEALGRLGEAASAEVLMQAMASVNDDRILEHSILYALMELGRPEEVSRFLASEDPRKQRAALLVLEQTKPQSLAMEKVFASAASTNPMLRQTALSIVQRRPESPPTPASLGRIDKAWASAEQNKDLLGAIVKGWGSQPAVQKRIAGWIESSLHASSERQDLLLTLLRQYSGANLATSWRDPLPRWLSATEAARAAEIARWLRPRTSSESNDALTSTLLNLAKSHRASARSALTFLAALPINTAVADKELAAHAVDAFLQSEDESLSLAAAEALQRIRLPETEAGRLLDSLDQVPPLRLPTALGAISRLQSDALDAQMLGSLKSLRTARTLTAQQITNLYRNRSAQLRRQAQETADVLQEPAPDVRNKVNEILARLKPGDPLKGYEVFRSNKAACSACHRIGYIGRSIGPDLTRIGRTRTNYDLLEAILFPSSRLEQSYQPVNVLTVDGRVINGLVKHQGPDRIEFVTGPHQTVTLSPREIEKRAPSEVSIMPKGLTEQISLDDLSHLMALLRAAK